MAPLGFLNPVLYAMQSTAPSVYNDIVGGNNRCAAGIPEDGINCCAFGFNATQGWDPLTGLGSINFADFQAEILKIKTARKSP